MKFKIEDFNGITPHVDENMLVADKAKASWDFLHKYGYLEADVTTQEVFSGTDSHEIVHFSEVTISTDPLTEDTESSQLKTFKLVIMKGTTHYDLILIGSDEISIRLMELMANLQGALYGLYHGFVVDLMTWHPDYMKVVGDRVPEVVNEDGVVKVHFPKKSLWIGHIGNRGDELKKLLPITEDGDSGFYNKIVFSALLPDKIFELTVSKTSKGTPIKVYLQTDYIPSLVEANIGEEGKQTAWSLGFDVFDAEDDEFLYHFDELLWWKSGNEWWMHFDNAPDDPPEIPQQVQGSDIHVGSHVAQDWEYLAGFIRRSRPFGHDHFNPQWNLWEDPTVVLGRASPIAADGHIDIIDFMGDRNTWTMTFNSPEDLFSGDVSLIQTYVVDNHTEIIGAIKHNYTVGGPSWLKIGWNIAPPNVPYTDPYISPRITGIKHYIKSYSMEEPELVWEENFLDRETPIRRTKTVSTFDLEGVTLSQNTGYPYDKDKDEKQYQKELLRSPISVATVGGVGLALFPNQPNHFFYCAVGGGKVMKDIYYKFNSIALGQEPPLLVAEANGKAIIFTRNKGVVVNISDNSGVLIFTTIDALPKGINNRYQVSSVQGGLIVLSRDGLMFTDGIQVTPIAQAIEETIMEKFASMRIYYDEYNGHIHLYDTEGTHHYLYRLIRKVWEGYRTMQNPEFLIVSREDGQKYMASSQQLSMIKPKDDGIAQIDYGVTNFGEPGYDKLLNEIWMDSEGDVSVSIAMDKGRSFVARFVNEERKAERQWIPLPQRSPSQTFQISFFATNNSKIYGLQMEAEVLTQGRYGQNNAIQPQQATSAGARKS
jgi:hypothetical protein